MRQEIAFRYLLKSFRVRKGPEWTQASIAKEIEVSPRLYKAWENGERTPSEDNLRRIVVTFNLNREDEETLYRAAAQAPPRLHNLPDPNPFFTGRADHLKRLSTDLQDTGMVEIRQAVSISGQGGIGKTQIALEYAHRHLPKVYLTVLWVNAADATSLQASYDQVAELLKLPERKDREPGQRMRAVKRWLEEHTSWLLVMDNADDLQLANSFLPARPLGHVVLTTRSQIVRDNSIARQINVDAMTPEEGVLFLLRRAGVSGTEDVREDARQLVELLGGHPLALDQAGAYIEETGESIANFIQLYQKERPSILGRRGPPGKDTEHPESVVVTVELSFRKVCERHPLAADVLYFCSFLQPDAMPVELFLHEHGLNLKRASFNTIMAAIRRSSLAGRDRQEDMLFIHRLVQAVLADGLAVDARKQWRKRVMHAVNAAFPEVDFKDWKQCGRLVSHALVCATWASDAQPAPLEAACLFLKAGVYLREQGQYRESEGILKQAHLLYTQLLGTNHLDTARSMRNLAITYRREGKYKEAEPLYHQALAIYKDLLGIDDPMTASAFNSLSVIYRNQGKYEEAESLGRQALTIYEEYGEEANHSEMAESVNNLAIISWLLGKYDQAEELYQRSLAMREKFLGPDHPYTLVNLNNLAVLYAKQGKYELAERLHQRALSMREKGLGVEHPETAASLHNLGTFYRDQGRYEQAAAFLQKALAIYEKKLGAEHPNTASSLHGLAELYQKHGKYAQAESCYQRAIAIREQCLGDDHPSTARSLHGLAKLLQGQGNCERADALYQRTLNIQRQKLGATHPHTKETKKDYAAFLRSMRRNADATTLESGDEPPA